MLQYLTFKKLDSMCLAKAKMGESDVFIGLRQDVINDIRYKHFSLLDGVNDPWWNKTISLTAAADNEDLADFDTGTGVLTALDASAHTITRSTGTFAAGAVLSIALVTKATGVKVAQYEAEITSAGATATYAVVGSVTGAETTYVGGTHLLFVHVRKAFSATSADLSTQYIKSILAIYDNAGTGGKRRNFDLFTDTRAYNEAWRNPYANNRVICLQIGTTLYITKGSTATALGTVEAQVKGKPSLYTDASETNLLDDPPEQNAMLEDEVTAEYAKLAGKPIPDDVQSRLDGKWKAVYDAAAAERAKATEDKIGTRSK